MNLKITALVENTANNKNIASKHGLSLFVKTRRHNILFDIGPDDTYIKNAKTLGIDLSMIDIVVISHGHSDHGGALESFLKQNKKANVYVQKEAFESHAVSVMGVKINVGLDERLKGNSRIKEISGVTKIDEELIIFSDVTDREYPLEGNKKLYMKKDGKYVPDDFVHEQHLLIRENGSRVVFSGCSHQGIVNIIKRANIIAGGSIGYMIAGMHLFNPINKKYEKEEFIQSVAEELSKGTTCFYTCHCTGEKAFAVMRSRLNERLKYLSAGESIEM